MGLISAATNVATAVGAKLGSVATGVTNGVTTAATLAGAVSSQQALGAMGDIATDQVGNETSSTLENYNDMQNKLAAQSMAMQVAGLQRSMVMQGLRDLIKDAKDTIKDQGEAGHKP
jgi:hypothetical protein